METEQARTRRDAADIPAAGDAAGHGADLVTGRAAGRPVPLRRNFAFQSLWLGQSAATLGVAVADVAYPLAILAVTGSPARAGLFGAMQAIGMLLAGLPGGALADRYDQRAIVVVTEACRAAITCLVVLALIGGWLSLPLLLSAAALLGAGQAVSGSARLLLIRSVVPATQLTRALTLDEVRTSGAALAGPALGGALFAVSALHHATPFLFAAGSFVVALLTAGLLTLRPRASRAAVPTVAEPGDSKRPGDRDMLAGLRTLWGQPVLRAAMLLIMMVNTVGAGLDLVIIVILRQQQVPAGAIGLALGLGAAGGLAGAPLVSILHRIRPGVLLLAVTLELAAAVALLALPFGPWWTAGLLFVSMLGVPAIRVLIDILVIRQAPPEQRGRVVAALMTLIGLGIPIGLGASGLLLQYLPAQAAMLILAAGLAVTVAYGAASPVLRGATWPGHGAG